jgi:hypothetical protein
MAGGAYATYSQYLRLQNARQEMASAEIDMKRSQDALTIARKQVEEAGRYAAVPSTDFEGTLFLNDLRVRADKAGTQIQSWRTTSAPAAQVAGSSAPNADACATDLLQGIDRVTSDLVLQGSYQSGRAFIEDLTRTSRLYTINNVRWARGDDGDTQLSVTVSRYVIKPTDSSTVDTSKSL